MISKNYKKVAIIRPSGSERIESTDRTKKCVFKFNTQIPFTASVVFVILKCITKKGQEGTFMFSNKTYNSSVTLVVGGFGQASLKTDKITQSEFEFTINNSQLLSTFTLEIDEVILIE